jgi:hypothetical protein
MIPAGCAGPVTSRCQRARVSTSRTRTSQDDTSWAFSLYRRAKILKLPFGSHVCHHGTIQEQSAHYLTVIPQISSMTSVSSFAPLGEAVQRAGRTCRADGAYCMSTEVERPAFVPLYGGWVQGKAGLGEERLDEGGPVLVRLSRFFMIAASWSTSRTVRLPRLAFMAAQAPSTGFSSGA